MKAISIKNPGQAYVLALAEAEKPRPRAGEILVKVVAAGVNRADLLQAMGLYPPPPGASLTLGLELSGEIAELGDGVVNHKVGDRVCALVAGGAYAEYVAVPVQGVLPVPKNVSLVDAAGLPEAHFTVWTNLVDTARMTRKDSVLIHGGSSGIGTTAIQLCAARGQTVFATAGSVEKCKACEALGAARAINYRSEDFVEVVKAATDGKGVDVILDMVGGDYIERNFHAAALWGRIVNVAYQSGSRATVDFSLMLRKRLTLAATTLRPRSNEEKGAIRDALLKEVWPLVEAGRIKPLIDGTFPIADAQAAHARMASSHHIGKILLTL
ncbi:MAG: NAD(P)H-quinone oxidoreductase [Alphaproteobacteria bacterium]|nr:NAD(P)H-quinone oxidoreductase [Alphaproteobacteria bacterium]MDE1987172.1 NAD(P)H-quinone oxidoreductase [Alphaproteobacteria bacterium]MDE2163626.1 NAD(P)H-quinone oxidoreductase [Alphaproteobacteria bacterium]MDE2266267.1 NAD(P)H-quinone oxidoreductase [Alphaproteobacteria bacterium]MDE2499374.1 NAD(P)H-quinone oxidoreductase [Alphaproteobacteria bacterium]